MAIRLNLLAEAQVVEELRRRDPVKRGILAGVVLVAAMLVWGGTLTLKAMIVRSELSRLETSVNTHTNDFQQAHEDEMKIREIDLKLTALHELATNRFLKGSLLNALQRTTVQEVQLTHLKLDQTYALIQETKAKTNGTHITPGKPAKVTEKIVLTLEAKDSSPNPGDGVNKYKRTIAEYPFFRQELGGGNEVRLKDLGAPHVGTDGKPYLSFSLECKFPERERTR